MDKKTGLLFLIPLVVAVLFTLFNLLDFYRSGDNRIYDLLLHVKPAVPEEESILLLDIDDTAIAQVGVWPWSRDIVADGLIVMKEFGANYVVFDIEYTEQSPMGVNSRLLKQEIPEVFNEEFAYLDQNIVDFFQALRTGSISLRDAEVYIQDLTGLTDQARDMLLEKVAKIARDNDRYLGQAARLFGKAFFTVTLLPEEEEVVSEELKQYVLTQIALQDVDIRDPVPFSFDDIRPAILPVLLGARGAGFPNVFVDEDGVRRRIKLITEYEGRYFPQLALAPLLDWLGNPKITISEDRIRLEAARLPDGQKKDILIPLAEDGHILINWPKKTFIESFRHLSFYQLVRHDRLEEDLRHNLEIMESYGFLDYYRGDNELLAPYRFAERIRNEVLDGRDPAAMEDYREARAYFFAALGKYLEGEAEQEILGDIEAVLSSEETTEQLKAEYHRIEEMARAVFTPTRELYRTLMKVRAELGKELSGSFCIVGHTGTSTTDIGVNPFEKEYMNVGTHASVANTILAGRFLDDLPWWYSAVAGFLLALLATFIIRNLKPLPSILVGIGVLIVVIAGGVVFFLFTGVYPNLLTPVLAVFFTFISLTLVKFLILEKERSFIRNAFSHYLSTDVINELIADPEKLNLGGEKKYLTAIFTDVRGFSSISEVLDPNDLVRLLNTYLTEMSNIIMDLKGTIDKYEGDAIISFFGAPVEYREHARNACLSAVRMKNMEQNLNERFIQEELSPQPLFTRIGINTGEMVVGNMGTDQKMDYTIMGNSVNLASRLEGVNKQYGTWILISESTYKEAGDEFTVRKLDRVEVVGIQEPVRLYELLDEKQSTGPELRQGIEIFHEGLELFEQEKWEQALKRFQEVLKVKPGDGPAEVFSKRCRGFMKKPPPESWDGVFKLAVK